MDFEKQWGSLRGGQVLLWFTSMRLGSTLLFEMCFPQSLFQHGHITLQCVGMTLFKLVSLMILPTWTLAPFYILVPGVHTTSQRRTTGHPFSKRMPIQSQLPLSV